MAFQVKYNRGLVGVEVEVDVHGLGGTAGHGADVDVKPRVLWSVG
jgi:hypothetical protein